jgi:hypothetical protein
MPERTQRRLPDGVACYRLLQRLAGTAPDSLISQCRQWLTAGRLVDVARAVSYAAVSQRLRLVEEDLNLLVDVLDGAGYDTLALSLVELTELEPLPMWEFVADLAGEDQGLDRPTLSSTGHRALDLHSPDHLDLIVIGLVTGARDVRALWRVWRYPGDRAPWPRPQRIYLVEVGPGGRPVELTGKVQGALIGVGESDPQVEVYVGGAPLPAYQQLARAAGALLWRTGSRRVRRWRLT